MLTRRKVGKEVEEMQPNLDRPAAGALDVPLRERTCADHDEPWQYAPYQLGLREKLELLKRRERMLAGEYNLATWQ